MPEISILIPTYKRARSLERCLRSVLASPVRDMEVLVSDNASPDATPQVIASFNDSRLRAWRNPSNLGLVGNMIEIVRQARGEWFMFVTDDDWLEPHGIERTLEVIRRHRELGVMLSPLNLRTEREERIPDERNHRPARPGLFAPGMDALGALYWRTHIMSRIACRTAWVDLAGMQRHAESLYPQMYMTGAILKEHPGYYLDTPLVNHTVGNPTHWSYPEDFMVRGRIGMVNDFLAGPRWRAERALLVRQIVQEIVDDHLPISWAGKRWLAHQRIILKIPEVRRSPVYWRGALRFLGARAFRRLRRSPSSPVEG